MRFNTIGVSDGISMGTDGMSFSLQSRDLIADSIETVMARPVVRRATFRFPAATRTCPAASWPWAASTARRIMIYGGTIRAGHREGRSSISSRPSRAMASTLPASSTTNERQEIVRHACPGAGACGGMYTANTMASAIEALGCHCHTVPPHPPRKRRNRPNAQPRGLQSRTSWNSMSSRATS